MATAAGQAQQPEQPEQPADRQAADQPVRPPAGGSDGPLLCRQPLHCDLGSARHPRQCAAERGAEAGPGQVGKGGVVRDAALHRSICAMIADWWAALPGWQVLGITESPITGPEGNKEFLIAARRET